MSPVPVECFPYGVEPQTGVCLELRLGPYRILLDCGLADISVLLADRAQPDAVGAQPAEQQPADFVVCSQAHVDHVRGLGKLHQAFPKMPIYTSRETQQILSHLEADPWAAECDPIVWNTPFELTSDLTLELIPAGQMPGAAVCLLTYTAKAEAEIGEVYTVAYTGDFYLTHTRFTPALSTASFKDRRIDLLILKGGYGTLQHPPRKQQESELVQILLQALAAQQSIVIPMPQVGLGQELLMLFRTNAELTRQQVIVWVDETVAQGCEAYGQMLTSLPASIQNFARQQSLFWQATGRLQIQPLGAMTQLPCILLIHHQTDLGPYAQILGDQVLVLKPIPPEAAVREHSAEAKWDQVSFPASWQRQTFLLAQACDGPSTTQLIHNSRPRHVAFYHRSSLVVEDLMQIPDLQNRYQLHPLIPGERLEVELAESVPLPQEALAPPLQTYSGELVESGLSATLSLGADILEDPRWQTFADTGLIEAVWQGHQLVIRGLSQAEILRSSASQHPVDRTCCANCHYYRNQRCWQTESALYGFKVSPQGTCPVHAPIGDKPDSLESGSIADPDEEGVDL